MACATTSVSSSHIVQISQVNFDSLLFQSPSVGQVSSKYGCLLLLDVPGLDSGAFSHMKRIKDEFNLLELPDKYPSVHIADGSFFSVVGVIG